MTFCGIGLDIQSRTCIDTGVECVSDESDNIVSSVVDIAIKLKLVSLCGSNCGLVVAV